MRQVFMFNTRNVSAQEEVNQLLTRMFPRWRLDSVTVTTTPWGETNSDGLPAALHLYHTTVVILEEK